MKRPILIAAAALLCFTACADADSSSSSLTSSEVLDSALEEYAKEENPYAFLPETVRLDDDGHLCAFKVFRRFSGVIEGLILSSGYAVFFHKVL